MLEKSFVFESSDAVDEFLRDIFIVWEAPLPVGGDGSIKEVAIFIFDDIAGRGIE